MRFPYLAGEGTKGKSVGLCACHMRLLGVTREDALVPPGRKTLYSTCPPNHPHEAHMQGKVVVITGATSGIGEIAAGRLAQQGARLLLIARDPRRARVTLTRLNTIAADPGHRFYEADLSRLSEMKRVAGEIPRAEPRIDVLINNAGAFFSHRRLSAHGLELSFAPN